MTDTPNPTVSPEVLAMSKAIVDLVKKRDHVTFAELGNHIGGFKDRDGLAISMGTKQGGRIVFWSGISDLGVDAFEHATQSGQITAYPVEALCYLIDGAALSLPVVSHKNLKAADKAGSEYWLPVAFRPVSKLPVSESLACFHMKRPDAPSHNTQ